MPDLDAFQENREVQDAVVRNIEIIGEAVSKIQNTAPDFIEQHTELPWAQIRGMRNVAIHEYFFVDSGFDRPMPRRAIVGRVAQERGVPVNHVLIGWPTASSRAATTADDRYSSFEFVTPEWVLHVNLRLPCVNLLKRG